MATINPYIKAGPNFQIKDRTAFFEPRGAWKNLLNLGIFGGNAFVSRLRRDPISASDSDFQFWRCVIDVIRTESVLDSVT